MKYLLWINNTRTDCRQQKRGIYLTPEKEEFIK